ncbi:MAG: ABC transporter permease [Bacillota bacterium]
MIDLLKLNIKEKILGKKNLFMLFVFIICISLFFITMNDLKSEKIYNIGIYDNDKTTISNDYIDRLNDIKSIDLEIYNDKKEGLENLKKEKIDILYNIEKGFTKKIKKGEFNNLISYNKPSTTAITSWLNDYVSIEVLKQWIYYDIYHLINKEESITYKDYEKKFNESYNQNEIIKLNVHNKSVTNKEKSFEMNLYVLIIGIISMYLSISFFKEIIDDYKNNVFIRLSIVKISRLKYYLVKLIVLLLYLNIIIISTYYFLKLKNIIIYLQDIKLIFYLNFFIITNFIIYIFINKFINKKSSFVFISQIYILISIFISSNIFKGFIEIVDKVKKFIPLSILIDNI